MDTKLKSKVILGILALLLTLGLNGLILGFTEGNVYIGKDYFHTTEFDFQLNQFLDYISVVKLNNMTKEEALKKVTVSPEEIKEHRFRYGDLSEQIANIKNQYEEKIQDALITNNKDIADTYIAERDKKIKDITNNFKSDEYVRVKIVKEKEEKIEKYFGELANYQQGLNRFQGVFNYYLKDISTKEVYTNLNIATDESVNKVINNNDMAFILDYPNSKNGYFSTEGRYMNGDGGLDQIVARKGTMFEGRIAVPKKALESSFLSIEYDNYKKKQKVYYFCIFVGIGALLLGWLVNKKTATYKAYYLEKLRPYYDRLPIDVRGPIFIFQIFLTFMFLFLTRDRFFQYIDYDESFISVIITFIITSLFVTLTMIQGKLWLEKIKDWEKLKVDWQKSLCNRMKVGIKEAFLLRSVGTQLFLILAVIFAFGVGTFDAFIEPFFFILYSLFVIFIVLPVIRVIVRSMGYFNNIVIKANELASGEFGSELPVVGNNVLAHLAENINTLGRGFNQSQREQAKSERLKTELITNVSHDLRTPLTSIITYTELLKTPDLSQEDREAYIQVIDGKSQRLKVLIDDLFEVSKMASGNIELVKEKVDLLQLLQQALGEHNETISESTLQFRVTNPDIPVYASVDGQKMWRVFDNLIGNILKYSLENTRVYITVKTLQNKAVITFKNVTKYELGENTDELFERFKRGDTSRHTEGSGLGLAIAKSIVDLHGGTLDIEVDGDLFKVTITLNNY